MFENDMEDDEKIKTALKCLDLIATEKMVTVELRDSSNKKNWVDIIMGFVAGGGLLFTVGYMVANYI